MRTEKKKKEKKKEKRKKNLSSTKWILLRCDPQKKRYLLSNSVRAVIRRYAMAYPMEDRWERRRLKRRGREGKERKRKRKKMNEILWKIF